MLKTMAERYVLAHLGGPRGSKLMIVFGSESQALDVKSVERTKEVCQALTDRIAQDSLRVAIAEVKRHMNTLIPIARLPTEILADVFLWFKALVPNSLPLSRFAGFSSHFRWMSVLGHQEKPLLVIHHSSQRIISESCNCCTYFMIYLTSLIIRERTVIFSDGNEAFTCLRIQS